MGSYTPSRVPQDQRFEVVPDWVCEVLSPSTQKKDRVIKMAVYANYGVRHLWLVDPLARSLGMYVSENGRCIVAGLQKDRDEVAAEPFDRMTLALSDLWTEG